MDMFCWRDLQQNGEFIDLTPAVSSWFNRKIPDYNGKSSTCRFMVLLLFFFLMFWRHLGGVWDFSSLTRDWTLTLFSGSTAWTTREVLKYSSMLKLWGSLIKVQPELCCVIYPQIFLGHLTQISKFLSLCISYSGFSTMQSNRHNIE